MIKLTMARHKQCPVQQTVPVEVKQCKQNKNSYQAGTYMIKLTMARHKQCPVQQTVPVEVKQCKQNKKFVPSRYAHDKANNGRTNTVPSRYTIS
jgi:hypothetical protein